VGKKRKKMSFFGDADDADADADADDYGTPLFDPPPFEEDERRRREKEATTTTTTTRTRREEEESAFKKAREVFAPKSSSEFCGEKEENWKTKNRKALVVEYNNNNGRESVGASAENGNAPDGALSMRIKSLEAILRALGDRNARLSETNAELKEECSKYKLDADRIAERFAMVSERVEMLEREREDGEERTRSLSEAYDAQTGELKRLERDIEGLRYDGERERKRLNDLEQEKRELEQELNSTKLDLETIREKYANSRADLTVVQAELDAYRWKLEAANAKIDALIRQRDAFNGLDDDDVIDDQPPLIPISPALVKGTQTTKKHPSHNKSTNTTNINETSSEVERFVLRERNAQILEENKQLKQALLNEEKMKVKALELANEARQAAAECEKRNLSLEEELRMYV
tara:strand:- start:2026 stop:3243 length:1218 start_codon:yes stop_codon:yes gene_type:complete